MYNTINRINKGVRAAIDYILEKRNASLVFSNIYPENPQRSYDYLEIVDFYTEEMKENGKSTLATGFITYSGDRNVTREVMGEMVGMFLKEIGIENSQYVVGSHNDTEDEHCHFITNNFLTCFCFRDYLNEQEEIQEKKKKRIFSPDKIFNPVSPAMDEPMKELSREELQKKELIKKKIEATEFRTNETSCKKVAGRRISLKEFNVIYKKTEDLRREMFIKVASSIEDHYGLKRNSVKVRIGKDRYIHNKYSIKQQLIHAFELCISGSKSFMEFMTNLKPVIQNVLKLFTSMLQQENRKKLLERAKNLAEEFSVDIKSYKNSVQEILFSSMGFKIKGSTLSPSLSLSSIWDRISMNNRTDSGDSKKLEKSLTSKGSVDERKTDSVRLSREGNRTSLSIFSPVMPDKIQRVSKSNEDDYNENRNLLSLEIRSIPQVTPKVPYKSMADELRERDSKNRQNTTHVSNFSLWLQLIELFYRKMKKDKQNLNDESNFNDKSKLISDQQAVDSPKLSHSTIQKMEHKPDTNYNQDMNRKYYFSKSLEEDHFQQAREEDLISRIKEDLDEDNDMDRHRGRGMSR